MIDEALARKLRLKGITKAARHPMFQGRRTNTKRGNFEYHGCWHCGQRFPCELAKCDHAVFTRIGPCCDVAEGKGEAMTTTAFDLKKITLKKGGHDNREQGVCIMEAVAWFAGRAHSDSPPCVCPVIGAFLRSWNDGVDDAFRQRLKPYIPRVVGTADAHGEERSWLAMDWIIREYLPAWLELAEITATAAALRKSPPILGPSALANVTGLLASSKSESAAARAAAGDAAWATAWATAWDAARAAAGDAAWDAARAAAGDAAWATAWAAARDAEWDAAWAAARDAEWDAAWNAARDALKPTVDGLQESAFGLLDRMIALGAEERKVS